MGDSNLPIDIHVAKLLDWVVSRKHCNKDWSDALALIREKIMSALQDMPENKKIAEILSRGQIHYYKCLEIVDILKETEADSKNMFGYYSSSRMKDWQEIVKMYEKDNVYLAEVAQIISRNVVHEIPSIKRTITKLENSAAEYNKKSVDFMKVSARMKTEYASAAAKFGIRGEDVKKELIERLSDFPQLIKGIQTAVSTQVKEPLEFYTKFVQFTGNPVENILPILKYLIEKGNTTVYEFKNGVKPETVEEFKINFGQDSEDDGGIDFGDDAIDFGDENEIDFGDDDAGTGSSESNGFVHVEEGDVKTVDRVARGTDALSILEFSETREAVVRQLSELETFLGQRLFELENEDDSTSFLLNQGFSQVSGNSKDVSRMLADIQNVIDLMTCEKMKVLHMIRDNPKYIERAVNSLKSRLEMSEKAEEKSRAMENKEVEAIQEQQSLRNTIPGLVDETKILQKKIEEEISKRYKNRPVNLMGGVQVL